MRRAERILALEPGALAANFHEIDLCDEAAVDALFARVHFDSVIHFAGLKAVGESVALPLLYYQNNLVSTLVLLRAMKKHGCTSLIFSSSATVYGLPKSVPITEDFPIQPTNPCAFGCVLCCRAHVLILLATSSPTLLRAYVVVSYLFYFFFFYVCAHEFDFRACGCLYVSRVFTRS